MHHATRRADVAEWYGVAPEDVTAADALEAATVEAAPGDLRAALRVAVRRGATPTEAVGIAFDGFDEETLARIRDPDGPLRRRFGRTYRAACEDVEATRRRVSGGDAREAADAR